MKSLKNTTAVLTALTMTLPQTGFAAAHSTLEACGEGVEAPCVQDETFLRVPVQGQGMITIPGLGATDVMARDIAECPAELDETATPCLTAEGDALFALDGEVMAALTGGEMEPAQEAETAEPVEEAEMIEEAEAPVENADEAVETEAVDGAGAVEAGSEPAGEGESGIASEAETPAEETQTETAAETEADVTAETETANTETETTIDEDTTAEVVEAPEEEQTVEAEETVIVEDEPAPAAAAATAEGEGAPAATVETEEVTEENSRSADEDFTTSASGTETAAATDAGGDDKGGLSNFEKALLLGLGAAVVGQALNNGDEVVSNTGDRVVVRQDNGELRVLKDDDALLRQPGSQVSTETFEDGSTRTTVLREDGTKIVTIRAADGRVVRRARVFEDGSQIVLFDDTEAAEPVNTAELPQVEEETIDLAQSDEDALRRALAAAEAREMDRRFSLRQIRQISEVRAMAPQIELDAITFATGSAAIQPSQAEELSALGRAMVALIEERPGEVFLIEGHTDTVGSDSTNLALSDRRAETVALALTQYFDVPPENMITQGYGESQLKIKEEGDIRENRRAVIRRITPLLRQVASAN